MNAGPNQPWAGQSGAGRSTAPAPATLPTCITITGVDIPFDDLIVILFKLLGAQIVVAVVLGGVVGMAYGFIMALNK